MVANPLATVADEPERGHENSLVSVWNDEAFDDSRGGTRTRDPGIMSAVL